MHIMQHMLMIVREFGQGEWINDHLAYVALPDAIRGMGVPRRCSHFERNDHGELLWYRFVPSSLEGIKILENFSFCLYGEAYEYITKRK